MSITLFRRDDQTVHREDTLTFLTNNHWIDLGIQRRIFNFGKRRDFDDCVGQRVQITGFGTFESKHRKARQGRNPRTGQTIQIAATNTPAFRAGKGLKDAIN